MHWEIMSKTNPNPAKGVGHGRAKLKEEDVISIRSRYRRWKMTYKKLAEEYGVSMGTIRHIVLGNTWKHVQGVDGGKASGKGD